LPIKFKQQAETMKEMNHESSSDDEFMDVGDDEVTPEEW